MFSVAHMDTRDTERENLRLLLGEREKKAFAREIGLSGGPSMLSQHLSGHRPISLEAAICYASGLGVSIRALSPRLAELLAAAQTLTDQAQDEPRHPLHPESPRAQDQGQDIAEQIARLVATLPPARWRSVRAQLDDLALHPEMRGDVLTELRALLLADPEKRQANGT